MRLPALACSLALALTTCGGERPRPGPLDPEDPANLSVRIVQPITGASVLGGRPLAITVEARDLAFDGLTGIGVVVRRPQPALLVDSQVVRFPAQTDSLHVFQVPISEVFTTNTQLDIRALGFGTGAAVRVTEVRSVIVIQCAPNIPGCT